VGGAGESDIKTLYSNVLKASGKEVSAQNNDVSRFFLNLVPIDINAKLLLGIY